MHAARRRREGLLPPPLRRVETRRPAQGSLQDLPRRGLSQADHCARAVPGAFRARLSREERAADCGGAGLDLRQHLGAVLRRPPLEPPRLRSRWPSGALNGTSGPHVEAARTVAAHQGAGCHDWRRRARHDGVVPLASLASGPGATLPACSAARLAA